MRPQGRSKIASSIPVDRVLRTRFFHLAWTPPRQSRSENAIHPGRHPAHAPFAVGKPQPMCFHTRMAGGPTHSKFTVQGLVSGKKHWFRVYALRGDGQSPSERCLICRRPKWQRIACLGLFIRLSFVFSQEKI